MLCQIFSSEALEQYHIDDIATDFDMLILNIYCNGTKMSKYAGLINVGYI